MLNRLSLARQLLVLQLGCMAVVVVTLGAFTMAQTIEAFDRQTTRRAMAVAEDVAATPVVGLALDDPRRLDAAQGVSSRAAASTSVDEVLVLDDNRVVIAAENPSLRYRAYDHAGSLVDGRGSSMTGSLDGASRIIAHAPVLGAEGGNVGFAVVAVDRPQILNLLADNFARMATVIVLGSLLGLLASVAISRRIKRQTLGLEPPEIVALVENREAMLHGIKEGVLAVDAQKRVTVANDGARDMLGLPTGVEGRLLEDVLDDPAILTALTSASSRTDAPVQRGSRVLVVNTRPISVRRQSVGWIATLRDRTELVRLEAELGNSRRLTDSLRAQSHEFSNQLQSVAGLLQMGDQESVLAFIRSISDQQRQVRDDLEARIADPAVVALLRAKLAVADERGISFVIDPSSLLEPVSDDDSVRLNSIIGNLVDNAFDACSGRGGVVRLTLMSHGGEVAITVRDDGPGVDPAVAARVFEAGVSTKVCPETSVRGFGLALVRRLCTEAGGSVDFQVDDDGTTFFATLPTERAFV